MELTIKQAADLVGLTPRALRHYESIGLFEPLYRTSTGYRKYDAQNVLTLLRIKRLSGLGLSLAEVSTVLNEPDTPEAAALLASAEDKSLSLIEELRQRIAELEELRNAGARTDVPADLAELLELLNSGGDTSPDATAALAEIASGIGGDSDVQRITSIYRHMIAEAPDPYRRLNELEDKLSEFGPDTPQAQLDCFVEEYAQAAVAAFRVVPDHEQIISEWGAKSAASVAWDSDMVEQLGEFRAEIVRRAQVRMKEILCEE
jgi:DNA-binding transcriptional MerR regulator